MAHSMPAPSCWLIVVGSRPAACLLKVVRDVYDGEPKAVVSVPEVLESDLGPLPTRPRAGSSYPRADAPFAEVSARVGLKGRERRRGTL